jgi:hypothetical protein
LKDIRITLYDIFGYLLPGITALFAVTVLAWGLFWPTAPYVVYTEFSGPIIVILSYTAYIAGHLCQACGNFLEKLPVAKDVLDGQLLIDRELAAPLKTALTQRFGDSVGKLTAKETYFLCDESLVHHGSFGEREIFIYREGFYRGMCVAFAVLSIGIIVRLLHHPARLWLLDSPTYLSPSVLVFALSTCVLGSWLCFRRYLRFAEIRIRTCLLRFLALSTSSSIPKRKEK